MSDSVLYRSYRVSSRGLSFVSRVVVSSGRVWRVFGLSLVATARGELALRRELLRRFVDIADSNGPVQLDKAIRMLGLAY